VVSGSSTFGFLQGSAFSSSGAAAGEETPMKGEQEEEETGSPEPVKHTPRKAEEREELGTENERLCFDAVIWSESYNLANVMKSVSVFREKGQCARLLPKLALEAEVADVQTELKKEMDGAELGRDVSVPKINRCSSMPEIRPGLEKIFAHFPGFRVPDVSELALWELRLGWCLRRFPVFSHLEFVDLVGLELVGAEEEEDSAPLAGTVVSRKRQRRGEGGWSTPQKASGGDGGAEDKGNEDELLTNAVVEHVGAAVFAVAEGTAKNPLDLVATGRGLVNRKDQEAKLTDEEEYVFDAFKARLVDMTMTAESKVEWQQSKTDEVTIRTHCLSIFGNFISIVYRPLFDCS
jgi:hypothetical protein